MFYGTIMMLDLPARSAAMAKMTEAERSRFILEAIFTPAPDEEDEQVD